MVETKYSREITSVTTRTYGAIETQGTMIYTQYATE